MNTHTTNNTLEEAVRPLTGERQKSAKRASSSGFAKRVWKTDSNRLTGMVSGTGSTRFRLFN